MNILILGGTSFFGKDIARAYFEAGHTVTLFTRGNEKPQDLPIHKHIKGNRTNFIDLQKANSQGPWDVLIDNIGYNPDEIRLALKAFPAVKRYIFNSTVSVYRYSSLKYPQPISESSVDLKLVPKEEDLSNVHWKYARGKRDAERVLVEEAEVPWTIIRPPVVYGPFDTSNRGFWYLARLMDGKPLILANGGVNSFRLAYSKDVAKAFLQVVQTEKTKGKTYFVGQKEIITLKDFLDESALALGVTPQYVNIPAEIAGEMGGPHAPMVNISVDISEAQKDFGFSPTPFTEFIASTALWFKKEWKGDRKALLATRPDELALINKWKSLGQI